MNALPLNENARYGPNLQRLATGYSISAAAAGLPKEWHSSPDRPE